MLSCTQRVSILNTKIANNNNIFENNLSNKLELIDYPTTTISIYRQANFKYLEQAEYVFFTSINSVLFSLNHLKKINLSNKKIIAIGKKTASYLIENGIDVYFYPKTDITSSEILISNDLLKSIQNSNIVLVRGYYGRRILYNFLSQKNTVVNLIVYEQKITEFDILLRNKLNKFTMQDKRVVILTSVHSFNNLLTHAKNLNKNYFKKLASSKVLVFSSRIAQKLSDKGFGSEIFIVKKMKNEGIIYRLESISFN